MSCMDGKTSNHNEQTPTALMLMVIETRVYPKNGTEIYTFKGRNLIVFGCEQSELFSY